jgi:hypothetical protein
MPYDLFVKAQIAGDQLEAPEHLKLLPGLGFYALSPEFQDDRVDVTTRGFLGLTVACAQCHNHKYDPIPTVHYYSLLGIFNSTKLAEFPLAASEVVSRYQDHKKKIVGVEKSIREFVDTQSLELAEILAAKAARYMLATRRLAGPQPENLSEVAKADALDRETLEHWLKYFSAPVRVHPFLKEWD